MRSADEISTCVVKPDGKMSETIDESNRLISVRSVVQLYPGPYDKSQSLTDFPAGEVFRVVPVARIVAEIVTEYPQLNFVRCPADHSCYTCRASISKMTCPGPGGSVSPAFSAKPPPGSSL